MNAVSETVLLSREIVGCYCTSHHIVNNLPTFLDLTHGIGLRAAILTALREGNHNLLRLEILAGFMGCCIDVHRKQPIDRLIVSALEELRREAAPADRDAVCARVMVEILQGEHSEYRSAENLAVRLGITEGIELLSRAIEGQARTLAYLQNRHPSLAEAHAG